jgi:3'-phosphoadenosine 5'-phosphosulfate sulfotransferase (PAPS reductase)/FAD synthetase
VRYSPMRAWSHELVFAFVHYYGLALPPIYEWEEGFKAGTHPWPAR